LVAQVAEELTSSVWLVHFQHSRMRGAGRAKGRGKMVERREQTGQQFICASDQHDLSQCLDLAATKLALAQCLHCS
jgi:hypothetical protein